MRREEPTKPGKEEEKLIIYFEEGRTKKKMKNQS